MAAHLHFQRNLKNLFEQFALIDERGRTNAQAAAALHQEDLVGIFGSEIQLVGDNDDGVAVLRRESAKGIEEANLRGDVEMQCGFIKQQKQGLLRDGARENHALFLSSRNLIHEAVAESGGAYLS